jgi:hypothetical protein
VAFPAVGATATSTQASGTSHTVTLPTGIAAGHLLVAIFGLRLATTVTWPAGWTPISTANLYYVAYRVADGGEGASITVTTSAARTSAHHVYRITGQHSAAPEIASADSATVNPPSLTPSWGADDTLWLASGLILPDDVDTDFTAAPASFTNLLDVVDASFVVHLGSARRAVNAASLDPAAFGTVGTFAVAKAATIAIRPDVPLPDGARVIATPQLQRRRTARAAYWLANLLVVPEPLPPEPLPEGARAVSIIVRRPYQAPIAVGRWASMIPPPDPDFGFVPEVLVRRVRPRFLINLLPPRRLDYE